MTGPAGPSDLYVATAVSADLSAGTPATVVDLTVPAGSYLLTVTGYGTGATADGTFTCQVSRSDSAASTTRVQPVQVALINAAIQPNMSLSGALVSTASQTLRVRCSVLGTDASIVAPRLMALKVGTVH